MKLRNLAVCAALALAVLSGGPNAHAGDPPDPDHAHMWTALESADLERAARVARERVEEGRDSRAGRWFAAWEHVRGGGHDGPGQRLEQAAHAADALGMNELSYRLWKRTFEAVEWANGRTRGRWAGVAAARSHHIDEAIEWLAADTECAGADRVEELRIWARSDMEPADRLRFAERFWMPLAKHWYHPRPALDVLLAAHQRTDLDDGLVDRISPLTYECAVRARDDVRIENVVRVWLRRRPRARVLETVEQIHSRLVEESALPAAEADAVRLLQFPEAEIDPVAAVAAGQHLAETGQTEAAERLFRRAIAEIGDDAREPKVAQTQEEREQLRALDTAHLSLAGLLESRGEFAAALRHYEAWTAWTGCGNCTAHALAERELHRARCLVGLGRVDEAIERHVVPHYTEAGPFGGLHHGLLAFHVETEAARGRLDELETWLDEDTGGTPISRQARALTRRFLDVRRASDARDAGRLAELLSDAGTGTVFHGAVYQDWEVPLLVRRAIDGLQAIGTDTAVDAIGARFDALDEPPEAGDPRRGVLLHALVELGGDSARKLLTEVDTRLASGENVGVARNVVQQLIRRLVHGY